MTHKRIACLRCARCSDTKAQGSVDCCRNFRFDARMTLQLMTVSILWALQTTNRSKVFVVACKDFDTRVLAILQASKKKRT